MKIRQIALDEEENPESVTVQMSLPEAAFIAKIIGVTNGADRDKMVRNGAKLGSEVYDALTGSLFNRFYHGGVEDVLDTMTPEA